MKILIESGATKSEWRILDSNEKFFLAGTNVSAMPIDAVKKVLGEGIAKCGEINNDSIEGFYLYTAGVVTDAIRSELTGFIRERAPKAEIEVQNDLLGAARGACGRESGIVAIMGTGANTCFYDGLTVSQKVYSGGFILGDDGSASVLGKLFIADWLKFRVPKDIAQDFTARFDGSYASIVENVYRSGSPSRYLGAFAPFLLEHYATSDYVKTLVDGNFRAFAEKSLLAYDVDRYEVGIVGGFGWACRDIVRGIFAEYCIRIKGFIPAPIDGLEKYH